MTLYNKALSPEKELDLVVKSIGRWLPDQPERTCAVLVPDNQRGFKVVEALDAANLPHDDLLRSTSKTRAAAKALGSILRYLAAPLSGSLLAQAYKTLRTHTDTEDDEALSALHKTVTTGLRRCDKVEAYLWPRPDLDWLADYKPAREDQAVRVELIDFRKTITHWLEASSQLPIDQLVLTIAPELYQSDDLDQAALDLALAHKLAVVLRQIANEHTDHRPPNPTA